MPRERTKKRIQAGSDQLRLKNNTFVIPAKAGIHFELKTSLDSRFRGNDGIGKDKSDNLESIYLCVEL